MVECTRPGLLVSSMSWTDPNGFSTTEKTVWSRQNRTVATRVVQSYSPMSLCRDLQSSSTSNLLTTYRPMEPVIE